MTTPAVPIGQVDVSDSTFRSSGVPELDRVLGGGLVPGAAILLAGEPGEESSDRVLLALPEVPAEEVAAASLVAPLTLVVTGPRARVA